ncbi:MAG TPA: DMT family transporter [Burkholderiaceae bacterium]|nr:DMT family transporter [Burkholderiaceae bacterium]
MKRWQANLLLALVAAIWGSAFVAQNLAMQHLGPMAFTGVRFLVGALVVLPLALREQRYLRSRGLAHGRVDALQVAGLGLLLWGGAALQQIGIQGTTVTNAGFLTALYVPVVPLLAWVRTGDAPRRWLWPAALGCLAGTWLLSGAGSVAFHPGDLWILASVLPWALHVLFVGEVAERLAAPFTVACGQFLACGLAALAWALVAEPPSLDAIVAAAGGIAYTGVLSVGVGFTAQVVAQRFTAPADAAILLSAETLFAALCGYLLMGDRLTAAGWAGAALLFGCMLAVQLLALRQPAPR